jgi:hypothetical protein
MSGLRGRGCLLCFNPGLGFFRRRGGHGGEVLCLLSGSMGIDEIEFHVVLQGMARSSCNRPRCGYRKNDGRGVHVVVGTGVDLDASG